MRLSRTVAALLVITGAGVVAPSGASAAPGFTAARALPLDAAAASQTRLGTDAAGRLTQLATRVDIGPPVSASVTITRTDPGQVPVTELVRSVAGDVYPVGGEIAVAASGAAVACINELIAPDISNPATHRGRVVPAFRPAGSGTWELGAPVENAVNTSAGLECTPAVGADGTAAVALRRITAAAPTASDVELAVRPPSGPWGPTQKVSADGRVGDQPQIAIADGGDLTIVHRERYFGNDTDVFANQRHTIKARRRSASNGVLGVASTLALESGVRNAGSPLLGMAPDGRAVVAWQWNNSGASEFHVWAAVRDEPAGTFAAPQQLVSDAAASSGPRAAGVAPDGTAYVGYWRQGVSSAQDNVGMRRRPAGGAWTPEAPVGPGNFSAFTTSPLAFVGADVFFAYAGTIGGSTQVLQAVRWRAGSAAPDLFADLVTPGTVDPSIAQVITDHQDGLAVVFDRSDVPAGISNLVAFDGSPPRLVTLGVPATAVAGQPTALSAAFADLWSALGPVTWDLGDGATASGPAITHTWTMPGTYPVTVRGRDSLGNERAGSATVVVSPPPGPILPLPAPPPDGSRPFASKLQVSRATVSPARRTLDVLAPITARATGRVSVAFQAAGRTTRFTRPIDTANRRLRFTQSIPATQARAGTGIMTLTYAGNAATRPQTVRLRAASRPAALAPTRPRLDGRRLRASGRISTRARGVVRVQLDWVDATGPQSVELNAPISGGRWTLDRQIPATAAQSIAARRSSLHSYVLFTGYRPARMRGEMRSYELAP